MANIPVFSFRYTDDDPIPFEIFRIEEHRFLINSGNLPRRDNFYVTFWVTEGMGAYYIDFQQYAIKPNTLIFIAASQIHYWEISKNAKGYGVPFEEGLIDLFGLKDFLSSLNLFNFMEGASVLHLEGQNADSVNRIFENLYSEAHSKEFGRNQLLASLMQIFFIKAQRLLPNADGNRKLTAGEKLVRDFMRLVQQKAMTEHEVAFYASELSVTQGHLTELVKTITGATAGELIRRRLVLEAKRLLAHSDLSVEQVCEQINFQDASYFSRFFKRETGESPRSFRDDFHKKP